MEFILLESNRFYTNLSVNMRENKGESSLILYSSLKSNWDKVIYTKLCTGHARRGIVCGK
jgi:hypothetical protein